MERAGRYRIVRSIATGGMAQVYEAIAEGDAGFERRVALKRILPELAHVESTRRMFLDEARIASHLHHAGIVHVLDFGIVDESEFMVFEYVDGVDAAKATRSLAALGAPMTEDDALYVISEIAEALAYAHERTDPAGQPLGIVHRDVSLSNVLLSWDGDVKLSDFGIAIATTREERTATGLVKGKLAYMAPEHAAGSRVTSAADVYALGATLFAMFRSRPPDALVVPTRAECPASDEGFAIVVACTAADPTARPSASEVAEQALGILRARRSTAGRGSLRRWLLPLRETLAAPSAFDRALDMVLVRAEGSGDREYTVTRDALGRASTKRSPSDAPTEALPASLADATQPRSARSWVIAVVLVISVLGAIGVVVGLGVAPWTSAPIALPGPRAAVADHGSHTRATPSQAPQPLEPDGAQVRVVAAPAPPLEAPPPSAVKALPRADRGSIAVSARPVAPRVSTTTAAPPDVEPARGWLRIGGTALVRAPVLIDGQPAGFTPVETELTIGRHTVRVTDPSTNAVLVDERVVIDAEHTRASPLRILRSASRGAPP